MTQEDKELLLRDLCARLPYGVIVDYKENEFESPHWKITTIYSETMDGWIGYDKRVGAGSESGSRPFKIGEVKPYLRPMSSMTEEEREELNINGFFLDKSTISNISHVNNNKEVYSYVDYDSLIFLQEFFNSHHLDYRGLIEKGLAIEVTEENNPYK